MKYSVIDISSSSLSMIVADADGQKNEIIFKDRKSLSLLHYLDGKKITSRGIEKLTKFVSDMKETCVRLEVQKGYLISTAVLRSIENFDEIKSAVAEKTGFPLNFIDGTTEAFCDYVANIYYATYERSVLIDFGGKSLEICDLSKNSKEDMIFFNFGTLDVRKKFVKKIQPSKKEAKKIKQYVNESFDKANLPEKNVYATAIMVGATARAVYDVYTEFANIDDDSGSLKTISYKKFKKLVDYLLTSVDRSKLIMNNAPEKLYLITPAAIVFKVLFKRFGTKNIIVSDWGVKEGYLHAVLSGDEKGLFYNFENNTVGGEARDKESYNTQGQEKKKDEKKTLNKAEKNSAKKSKDQSKSTSKKTDAVKGTESFTQIAEKTVGDDTENSEEITVIKNKKIKKPDSPSEDIKIKGNGKTEKKVKSSSAEKPADSTKKTSAKKSNTVSKSKVKEVLTKSSDIEKSAEKSGKTAIGTETEQITEEISMTEKLIQKNKDDQVKEQPKTNDVSE